MAASVVASKAFKRKSVVDSKPPGNAISLG
jgi:hypothetical protein